MNKLNIFKDERGGFLIPFEFLDLPFTPKRIFMVSDVPKNGVRGEHAHFSTQQILICVKGQILVGLDYGLKYEEHIIDQGETIFIDKLVWDFQKFLTGDDVMCVVSSTNYNISDYIFDKNEFYKIVKK
jgi:UDP-2-acetamido-3-amino-2,3-dideoxy-glucuronate N-acetyltransferase